MREAVGRSLLSSHLESQEWESAIDRVGALSFATKLGRLIFHWKYARQERFAGPVLFELLRKARHRFQIAKQHREYDVLGNACLQAMAEFYSPGCEDCDGAGEMIHDGLRIVCQSCLGSGQRRFPDHERISILRIDSHTYRATWERRLQEILGILSKNDSSATAECRVRLGRDTLGHELDEPLDMAQSPHRWTAKCPL